MILTLHGHCPAKKNNWRTRAGGGTCTDREAAELIQAMIDESWIEWKKLHAPSQASLLEGGSYRGTRAAASLGAWDIIGIGSTDVVLVRVKTRDWPRAVEMETLRLFAAPGSLRKLVHRWRDRQWQPDAREALRAGR